MLRARLAFFAICSFLAGFAGCSSDDAAGVSQAGDGSPDAVVEAGADAPDAFPVCEAGRQASCACVGGGEGAQRCLDDGSGWGSCECPDADQPDAELDADDDALDGEDASDARPDGDSGEDADAPDATDAAEDVEPDAPPDVVEEPECTIASDCPGADANCSHRACDAGHCVVENELPGALVEVVSECESTVCDGAGSTMPSYASSGTPLTQQTAGDCVTAICDGHGGVTSEPALTDLPPDDGNECTDQTCTAQGPETTPATGRYCNSSCWCDPCGGTNPTEDDFSCDWGLCNNGACVDSIPVNCAGSGWSYHGCHSAQPASYWISWGDTPETRCMGYTDVGYCPPGTACTVYHDTLGILYGTCQ